jgi:hypothetical protein
MCKILEYSSKKSCKLLLDKISKQKGKEVLWQPTEENIVLSPKPIHFSH